MGHACMPAAELLLPMLRRCVEGAYGIAIGGAHAKGVEDAASDLDLYVFYTGVRPDDERTQLARACAPGVRDIVSWSAAEPFEQAGTDFYLGDLKVECWYRSAAGTQRTIEECQAGIVRRSLVTWTPAGFFNHCTLSDLSVMMPVEDPTGMLAGWRRCVAVYPPALRAAIVTQHLRAARFWPHNPHYTSAVERADAIYTSAIVLQVAHSLIQVLFAVNRRYFPGDKKLAAALGHLTDVPDRFPERVERLLFPQEGPSADLLSRQQRELQALLVEVEGLVERHPDAGECDR
jgi:hypothetical protein